MNIFKHFNNIDIFKQKKYQYPNKRGKGYTTKEVYIDIFKHFNN
jgi:hypothetical protein